MAILASILKYFKQHLLSNYVGLSLNQVGVIRATAEHSGSVECLNRDRRVACLSLTAGGVTEFCLEQDTLSTDKYWFKLKLETCPDMTEKLLTEHNKFKQTKQTNKALGQHDA